MTPLLLKILASRGLTTQEEILRFLNADLSQLEDPFLMKGMACALKRIRLAVSRNEKVMIHGDYDVDGITATAILAKTLLKLGIQAGVYLPDRLNDGYGISLNSIEEVARQKASLFITVDCGISAHEELEKIRAAGCEILVIDHHKISSAGLPPADIILNPLQDGCLYPCKDLSAAALVFKLAQALIGDAAFEFLDLVALSTVADVVPLLGENRILVKEGLKHLTQRRRLGVRELAEISGIKSREMNVGHIGFILAPRINAAGRMSHPEIALQLFMTENAREAASLARVLHEENKARQKEEKELLAAAVREVEKTVHFNRDKVIVVGQEGWHIGIIGIIASRLVEKYHRPAIVISFQEGKGKGSGRSLKGIHLFHALQACGDLLEEFGGHELAAGLVIQKENLIAFKNKLNDYVAENIPPEVFVKKCSVDLEISLEELNRNFIEELKSLEPHGMGNPRPIFHTKGLRIKTSPRPMGQDSFKFLVTDGVSSCEAVWNNRQEADSSWLRSGRVYDFSYTVRTNYWNGIESIVMEIKDFSEGGPQSSSSHLSLENSAR